MRPVTIVTRVERRAPTPTPVPGKYVPALPVIPLPPGQYIRVLWDHQATTESPRLIRVGMPGVLSLTGVNQFNPLDRPWQEGWFAQIAHARSGYKSFSLSQFPTATQKELKSRWSSLIKDSRAFTNDGPEHNDYRDYINDSNKGDPDPKQEPLTCAGNVHRLITTETVKVAGQDCYAVYALNGTAACPDVSVVNALTYPYVIPRATNCAADKSQGRPWKVITLPDGTWRVDPFPQFAPYPTPLYLRVSGKEAEKLDRETKLKYAGTFTEGGIQWAIGYIRKTRAEIYTAPYVPNPYNPPQ